MFYPSFKPTKVGHSVIFHISKTCFGKLAFISGIGKSIWKSHLSNYDSQMMTETRVFILSICMSTVAPLNKLLNTTFLSVYKNLL